MLRSNYKVIIIGILLGLIYLLLFKISYKISLKQKEPVVMESSELGFAYVKDTKQLYYCVPTSWVQETIEQLSKSHTK